MAASFNSFCRFYFTIIEPALALIGTYMCFFAPLDFAHKTLLPNIPSLSTLERVLIFDIGVFYAMLALMSLLVLRPSQDKRLWRRVLLIYGLCDLGSMAGVHHVMQDRLWNLTLWTAWEFASNFLILGALALRIVWVLTN